MKLVCKRAPFAEVFQLAAAVAGTRGLKSVLQNVKIEARKGRVELISSDYEISMRLDATDVEVQRTGDALLPAARVAAILRESSQETVQLEVADGICVLSSENAEFRIPCDTSTDFPEVPSFQGDGTLEVAREDLRDMIRKTVFATAQDNTRYSLNGVLLSVKGSKMTMVATDGRRLAIVNRKAAKVTETPPNVIIPTKALHHLDRLMSDADERVALKVEERSILARVGRGTLVARLVDGHFPPYDEVVPKDCDKKVELPREPLLSAIRRAELVTTEDTRVVDLAFSEKGLHISASSSEAGQAWVDLPIEYAGDEVTVAFNPQFLEDVLKVADRDTITMELKDSRTQVLLRAGENYLYVVMPVIRSAEA
ncbi:MAG: DNA polymerase III subunit beta [Planctomycetota bacterium]